MVGMDGSLSISSFSFLYYYYMFLGPASAHLEIGGVMRFTLFLFFFFYLFPFAWKVVVTGRGAKSWVSFFSLIHYKVHHFLLVGDRRFYLCQ